MHEPSKPFKKGDVVEWRGGRYRVVSVHLTEMRIESIEYPGAFNRVSFASARKVPA